MSDKTGIHWTDATWNPTTGCTRVSDGCRDCYAFGVHDTRFAAIRRALAEGKPRPKLPRQYDRPFSADYTPPGSDKPQGVQLHSDRLDTPLKWRAPRRVFVDSMSDLWHETVPDDFILRVFTVMRRAHQHTFQVLTKRPERMRDFVTRLAWRTPTADERREGVVGYQAYLGEPGSEPLRNVWLGTSVEHQQAADERIPLLLQTPAAVRFLSCEPLLGPMDLTRWIQAYQPEEARRTREGWQGPFYCSSAVPLSPLHWIIVGGESGPRHRPMDPDWGRSLRDQCQAAGVPFFYKQSSGARPGTGRELDGRLWEEMPARATYREEHEVTCVICKGGVTVIYNAPPVDDAQAAKRAAYLAEPVCSNCHFVAGVRAGVYGR